MKFLQLAFLAFAISSPLLAQTATLRGKVTDESGAVIPGAKVTVNGPSGLVKTTASAPDGTYSFAGLPPGDYTVQASAPDLALAQPAKITLNSGSRTLNVQLKVASTVQQVTVQENAGPQVTADPSNNASALVLTGEDLEALPDDPDDLQQDLQALAGPSAGPNGGQIYIDGFSGGELPPKESIREIRINSNPFSPEYDSLGYGRIQIFTKPGTDKFRGSAFFNYGDDFWNSRNPYAEQKAPFRLEEYGGNLSGPLNKRASFFLDIRRDSIDNGNVINGVTLDTATLGISPFTSVLNMPQRRIRVGPRIDYQLSANHTLTLRYAFTHSDVQDAGIGGFNLVSRGYHRQNDFQTVQATETAVIGTHTINETRFQYFREGSESVANTLAPAIQVLGSFNGGGAQTGHALDRQNTYELQNYTSIAKGAHAWKFGVRMRGETDDNASPQNFGGTFTFGGGLGPALNADNQPVLDASGNPVIVTISSIEQYRRTVLFTGQGLSAAQVRALGGGATQFTINSGTPTLYDGQFDVGLFAGDDWRLRPNLTASIGLRYEAQTNIHDRKDFAPRIGLAWAPGATAKKTGKTVLRGGFGIFYTRFDLANTLTAERYNGVVQQQYVVTNPDFYPDIPPIASISGFQTIQAIQEISARLHAPYMMQSAASVERQLPGHTTLAVTYTNSRGLHMLRSEDINAPLPGTYNPKVHGSGVFPLGSPNPVFLVDSSGLYNQNQLMTNVNSRLNRNVSLFGFYTLNYARSNTDGISTFPANPYSSAGEYGPAANDVRHRMFIGGSIESRWAIRLSPFVSVQTGAPYNITTGSDIYGDTLFNSRPGIATDPDKPGLIRTAYGLLDPNPTPGESILPRNFGRGPGSVSFNARLSKTFGFGAPREGAGGGGGFGGGPGGPGGGERRGGGGSPFGGGGGPGGLFNTPSTAHRYNLTISMSARNLLNHNNPGPIIGNITSPLFDRANSAAIGWGGGFAENANNRRLELQLRFTF
jgi:hypothetical protein